MTYLSVALACRAAKIELMLFELYLLMKLLTKLLDRELIVISHEFISKQAIYSSVRDVFIALQ